MQKPLKPISHRAYDILKAEKINPLDAIFAPQTIAVICASEKPDSVGRTFLWNLISNPFGGTVFPVNPHRQKLGFQIEITIDPSVVKAEIAVMGGNGE